MERIYKHGLRQHDHTKKKERKKRFCIFLIERVIMEEMGTGKKE